MDTFAWPKKTREFHNPLMNSRVWNAFRFHDDDVVIVTWGKSGTTWMQQIVAQLVFKGADNVEVCKLSPWVAVGQFEFPLSTLHQTSLLHT